MNEENKKMRFRFEKKLEAKKKQMQVNKDYANPLATIANKV